MAAIGGVLGCVLAVPMHGVATGAFNWSTFAEVAFEFAHVAPLFSGVVFGLAMGVLGGLACWRLWPPASLFSGSLRGG